MGFLGDLGVQLSEIGIVNCMWGVKDGPGRGKRETMNATWVLSCHAWIHGWGTEDSLGCVRETGLAPARHTEFVAFGLDMDEVDSFATCSLQEYPTWTSFKTCLRNQLKF